jgi:AcrR family transcriptional regulator
MTQPSGDHADERRRLLDAARVVLARTGWSDFKVKSVLRESGLSTRQFYRHFDSKDALLFEVYGQEVERRVRTHLPQTSDAVGGVTAFIDAVISSAYDAGGTGLERRYFALHWRQFVAERPQDADRIGWPLVHTLEAVIRRGLESGEFPAARPPEDAITVVHLVVGVLGEVAVRTPVPPRDWVRDLTIPFALTALTAPVRFG